VSASAVASGTGTSAREGAGRGRTGRFALNVVSVVAGVGLWWGLAAAGLQFPTPVQVLARGWQMALDGTLLTDVLASVRRVLIGFALGSMAAIVVGFLMGWFAAARALLEPWVQFFRTIPPLALLPIVLVLLGIGETPKIFVIFLASFLSCVISTFQGVTDVDRTLINAARVLGSSGPDIFLRVVVPATAPFILVGMRVGLGSAWGTLVASEMLAAQDGLGQRMQRAQLYYDLPTIYVSIIAIGVLGLVMDRLLQVAGDRVTGWQERR